MYLLPILFTTLLTDIDRNQILEDDNLDDPLFPDINSFSPFSSITDDLVNQLGFNFWKHEHEVTIDKDNFKIFVNTKLYKPDEIKVKVDDGYVVIEGKHKEREDKHGFVSRQFIRRYLLPSEAEPNKITSHISKDGILTVIVPLKKNLETTTENTTAIKPSNKPPVTQKDNDKKVTEKSNNKATTKEDLKSTTPKSTTHAISTTSENTTYAITTTPENTTDGISTTPENTTHGISTTPENITHGISTTPKNTTDTISTTPKK